MYRERLHREEEECRKKIANHEQAVSDMQRRLIQVESETDKDRALLEQKVEFLERTISELQKKETDHLSDLKQVKKDH